MRMRSPNNQKWAYQSISHGITKYRYWMTGNQSGCRCTQWAKTNSRSQNVPWRESQERIHQTIKVTGRIPNPVCTKEGWHEATMCRLQTTQWDN
jgi:hypothetical protein